MPIGKAEVKHRVVVNGREAQLVVEQGSDGEEESSSYMMSGTDGRASPDLAQRHHTV